ncbi:MAG TPA: hypothetical protein VFX35_06860 [Solirubrobacterales bacterium]|nr:hypothetical protein [Solirubrobacterales bacterium]
MLDWLLVNERLVSLQRLRNLAADESDRALMNSATEWLAQWRRKSSTRPSPKTDPDLEAAPLFLNEGLPVQRPDPAFLANGLLKSWMEPTRRSGHPDLAQPVNFAFRMRSLLGVGARAEVVRVLLTSDEPGMSLQAIAAASGFAKRNVQEAAASLRAAGTVTSWNLGNEQRFDLPREPWLHLLSLEQPPTYKSWPQLFRGLRVLLRWLRDPEIETLSEYMGASRSRTLLEQISEDFLAAGVSVEPLGVTGELYPLWFETWVRGLGESLAASR